MSALQAAAVLFDLDGTLVDTAPDMAGALNDLRAERGLDPLPYASLRPLVSHGSRALVDLGLAPQNDEQRAEDIAQFLTVYASRVARDSALFDGMAALLAALEAAAVPWGVVTNKPAHLSEALLEALALTARCAVLIGGDTLALRKPHPLPLVHAATHIGVPANACVYVGDAERDVRAGRAAGMTTMAAAWGYLQDDERPAEWGADFVVQDVATLHRLLVADGREETRRAGH